MIVDQTDTDKKDNKIAGLKIPTIIFGTSGLGNLFVALDDKAKLEIVKECIRNSNGTVVFDSAGKYGAGLALETLSKCLKELDIKDKNVIISNKLGWVRSPLTTAEPTFEPGVWKDLRYDAVQKISYDGMLECFEQGNDLLQGYIPQMVSVHDADEYISTATNEEDAARLYHDVLDAYRALSDLKKQGKVKAIGVGAKDWRTIQKIANDVELDWVMFANSLTILKHPNELLKFMQELENRGVVIINSAVFHSGFLIGSDYFDYKLIKPDTPEHQKLFQWRADFFKLCKEFDVKPAEACVQFALNAPGVVSVALNTTNANRVKQNVEMTNVQIPAQFWCAMKSKGLIEHGYQYV
ncbi:MAG: aldo/keto reductase [Segetibacter sp.]|jgi:D-threo-aldose 1-dehydrogenase|nr:aldo/keto reductase [Segetibacter sp.]